tara:strand:+ start:911 stop:1342 length:432 start_codon:yes stop_codon:yes gene_type:complete
MAAARTRVLYESSAVSVTLESTPGDTPHLRLTALQKVALAPADVERVLAVSSELLDSKSRFKSSWDLRNAVVPKPSVAWACIKWALANRKRLDASNERMSICMPPGQHALTAVVKLVLSTCAPTNPYFCSESCEECEAFMRLE